MKILVNRKGHFGRQKRMGSGKTPLFTRAGIVLLTLLVSACNSRTRYLNPNKTDVVSRDASITDIKMTTRKMVKSLSAALKGKESATFIEVRRIRNRTSEHIDTQMVANIIMKELIKRNIQFIDAENREASLKTIRANQSGLGSGDANNTRGLKNPNFFLSGEITENLAYDDDKDRYQFLLFSLKLTSVKTGTIRWFEDKKILKKSAGKDYRW